jgi:ribonuclease G
MDRYTKVCLIRQRIYTRMKKEIILNATANEIRIAITEDGRLAELFVESPEKDRMVGDIYLGRVARVMPGIKAAFIDIGHKQDAFLHFSDIGSTVNMHSSLFDDDDADIDTDTDDGDQPYSDGGNGPQASGTQQGGAATTVEKPRTFRRGNRRGRPFSESERRTPASSLKKGQDIIIQVIKEPVANKGVRVTSEVSLPGRYLVLIPFGGQIGVSKKISNFREKRRLRRIVRSILPEGYGAIIRTVADGRDENSIRVDLEDLLETWKEIEQTVKNEKAPALLYKDISTTSSVIRDLFTSDVERIVVDAKKLHREIRTYVKWFAPQLADKVELFKGKEPVFDVFGIEKEIAKTLQRKVWLKSGGYVIIEPTEAMTVIDVNSGRYAANQDQELNSLRTNLEAAREIARQIRLRDIGGIIVIDCIDLDEEKNQKKVYDEFKKEFRKDRAKVTVYPMTELALVQITRQRIRQNILHSFAEPCPTCGGAGLVPSKATIVNRIERWIRRMSSDSKEFKFTLFVNPTLATFLTEGLVNKLLRLQFKYRVRMILQKDSNLAIDEFRFISYKLKQDITDKYVE